MLIQKIKGNDITRLECESKGMYDEGKALTRVNPGVTTAQSASGSPVTETKCRRTSAGPETRDRHKANCVSNQTHKFNSTHVLKILYLDVQSA